MRPQLIPPPRIPIRPRPAVPRSHVTVAPYQPYDREQEEQDPDRNR